MRLERGETAERRRAGTTGPGSCGWVEGEVHKRMATLEYRALFEVVESWSGGELGWAGINWVLSKEWTWQRWKAATLKAFPRGSFFTRASLIFRLSKSVFFLDRMYLESMLVISS